MKIQDERTRCSRMAAVLTCRSHAAFRYLTDLFNDFANATASRASMTEVVKPVLALAASPSMSRRNYSPDAVWRIRKP
jgi:hypothetical protein